MIESNEVITYDVGVAATREEFKRLIRLGLPEFLGNGLDYDSGQILCRGIWDEPDAVDLEADIIRALKELRK